MTHYFRPRPGTTFVPFQTEEDEVAFIAKTPYARNYVFDHLGGSGVVVKEATGELLTHSDLDEK